MVVMVCSARASSHVAVIDVVGGGDIVEMSGKTCGTLLDCECVVEMFTE